MTALERAEAYAAIFVRVGDNWPHYVPVDATVKCETVYLDGVCLERQGKEWRLTENGRSWIVRQAVAA